MKAADDRGDRVLAGQPARVADGVDDPRVAASAHDHQAAVANAQHQRLVVEDERVGLPLPVAQRLVTLKARLERRGAVDLAGDQRRAVEQEGRPALLHDLKADVLQRRAAGRGQLARIQAREADPPAAPELRVDRHRQAGAAERSDEPLHPGDVVPVPVAEHDHLDVPDPEPEPAHVLDHPVRRDTRVEQQRSLPPTRSIRTSAENPGSAISASGTPVFGRTRAPAVGSAPVSARGQLTRWTPAVDQQRVGEVVDQDRDPDPVDRLELDRHVCESSQRRAASRKSSCGHTSAPTTPGTAVSQTRA